MILGGNGSGANAAVCWPCDDRTDETGRSGQDDGVLGVHVSQVQVQVQGVHTYSSLVDGVVERRFLRHVVVGKWRGTGEACGLPLDPVKDTVVGWVFFLLVGNKIQSPGVGGEAKLLTWRSRGKYPVWPEAPLQQGAWLRWQYPCHQYRNRCWLLTGEKQKSFEQTDRTCSRWHKWKECL